MPSDVLKEVSKEVEFGGKSIRIKSLRNVNYIVNFYIET